MRVELSAIAGMDLAEIFRYNADRRGEAPAVRYEDFLIRSVKSLATEHTQGKAVSGFPELRRMAFKMNPRGDGHIAVYMIDVVAEVITVVRLLHTKMDLDARLGKD